MANSLRARLGEYASTLAEKQGEVDTLGHRLAQEKAQLAESNRRADLQGDEVRRLRAELAEYEEARLNAQDKATQIDKTMLAPLAKAC